ncbi:hypothetical protein NDU88_006054 [Pleurodeles waltl]|uniref:Uncharacterized protein n=1 Tax=Pleurodeles waltl TaxID=8319 RepID=A0AAV7L688_PLEWA|nr:hypothetical protein NDU88_006054 [Pleurodeles waltl]
MAEQEPRPTWASRAAIGRGGLARGGASQAPRGAGARSLIGSGGSRGRIRSPRDLGERRLERPGPRGQRAEPGPAPSGECGRIRGAPC